MIEDIKKPIANVTINYEDGTQSILQYYAISGFGEDTWYKITNSPPLRESKIRMNNYLVEMSNELIESIGV
ncbi:MAG: hypothetical protein ACRKGH_02650 [Dehalogenimonas sp.]